MADNNGCYEVYSGGSHLEPGRKITVESSISFNKKSDDISELTDLPLVELQNMRGYSEMHERQIFNKLCAAAKEWERQAATTMLIDKAIEYLKAPAVEHTSNKWQLDKYGNNQEISNMVYKMYYRVSEDIALDREKGEHVTAAWKLKWKIIFNSPVEGHRIVLDGQDKKRFTDKSALEKYLQGRIKAYAHHFTEISPSIPKGQVHRFSVNGELLPGYRVEGQPTKSAEERPSALDKLAAAKEDVAKDDAKRPSPDKSVGKSHAEEL